MSAEYYTTLNDAYSDAVQSLASGKHSSAVLQQLIMKGVPPATAEEIIAQARRTKKAAFRKAGLQVLITGIAFFILGAVITGVSHSLAGPGGTYFVAVGMFVVGAINIFKGLFRIIAG